MLNDVAHNSYINNATEQKMTTATFTNGTFTASCKTEKKSANFALIGNFDGKGFKVISTHAREDLAKPSDVSNAKYSNVVVAKRV